MKETDRSYGSPYDRGGADSYYQRPGRPHYYNREGERVTDLTPDQIAAYNKGFDDGLDCAIKAAENTTAGAMRFPNGKSFADCIKEELDSHRRAND